MSAIGYTLSSEEVRVLGSLIEKEFTTPDYYPLTLNALTAACNQKSSRDPVVNYDDALVQRAVESLREKALARMITGDRAAKYRELLLEKYNLTPKESSLLCVLMLRGPQTPGDLRGRTGRIYEFGDLTEVETTLQELEERNFIRKLPRQPGARESRFAHVLAGEPEFTAETASAAPSPAPSPAGDRIAKLEEELAQLRDEVADLRNELASFRKQFE
jgi:uncharacterized protein YceH (UPF0502 family)